MFDNEDLKRRMEKLRRSAKQVAEDFRTKSREQHDPAGSSVRIVSRSNVARSINVGGGGAVQRASSIQYAPIRQQDEDSPSESEAESDVADSAMKGEAKQS